MKLKDLLTAFNAVAPEHLAEDWDQVGVHLAGNSKAIKKAMLCIDLTPAVLAEAIAGKCQLIVAYHPPIFHPLKRLADRDWKETMLAEAVRKGIAVYSPHTALDAVRGGMNDWLCDGLGAAGERWSIGVPKDGPSGYYKIVVFVPTDDADKVRDAMFEAGGGMIGRYKDCSYNLTGAGTFHGTEGTNPAVGSPGRLEVVEEMRIEMVCDRYFLPFTLKACRDAHPYEEPAIDVFQLMTEPPLETEEQTPGRVVNLKKPVSAQTLIRRIKRILGVKHLKASIPSGYGYKHKRRIAQLMEDGSIQEVANPSYDENQPDEIDTIAVCVGAGGSLFEKYPGAEAYITGEMQHHQILDLYQKGKVVILAGHTNTERPFLGRYRDRLIEAGAAIDWQISEADKAPMQIV
ncbi:MAG: Nif3-like dinuclear metal center hexameric protein [Planctomycetota bacterium]